MYNTETSDDVFVDAFESRFPGLGEKLFNAQKQVSKIPLIIASYWNATWDYTLYSEGLISIMNNKKVKLISLQQMCDKIPMDPDYLSVKDFIQNGESNAIGKITPVNLADSIDVFCNEALTELKNISAEGNNDLLYEISDIRTWANLGLYFSNKLHAAVQFQKYLDSGDKTALNLAIEWLTKANGNWHQAVVITQPIYKPMPLQHYERNDNEYFHWSKVETEVMEELESLKKLL